MALHFSESELQQRRERVCDELQQQGLHAMLCFRQETDFYLTGYDTFGYCFFQCLLLCADGRMMLLTRAPDLRQAQHTSVIEDIRIWVDKTGSNPSRQLVDILDEFGCRGKTLGIEFDAYGLTAKIWRQLEAEISGFCGLEDVSALVSGHRLVKSDSEIEYVKRAAELADDALDAALPLVKPGAWKVIFWPRCIRRFFRAGVITLVMNSLSVPAPMPCFADTSAVANISVNRIN